MRSPICNKCKKKMFREKKNGFVFWDCKKHCKFHFPIWEIELSNNEKKFIKSLNKK